MAVSAKDGKKLEVSSGSFFLLLGVVVMLLVPASIFWIVFETPNEAQLGIVQKIFYYHVPSAFMMYVGFGIAFLGSLYYLFIAKTPAQKVKSDQWASAGAEVGQLFASIVLLTGPLWAYKSWGTFWTWNDPQLTAVFLIYLLFWSYLAIRAFAGEGERRRNISAIIAILAAPNMAFIHWAVTVTHPKIMRGSGGRLAPSMVLTLMICLVTIALLFAVIFWLRLRVGTLRGEISALKERLYSVEDKRAALEEDSSKLSTQTPVASSAIFGLPIVFLMQPVVSEFVPATGPTESIPGGNLLAIAYAGTWALVLLYVIILWRRQSQMTADLRSLKKQIQTLEESTKKG